MLEKTGDTYESHNAQRSMQAGPFTITVATQDDLPEIRILFGEYTEALGVDLKFQDYSGELEGLPGKYVPPDGALLIARDERGEAVGCIAMRSLGDGNAEMKRLYTRPSARGHGLGRTLAELILNEAKAAGYKAIRLDTLPILASAHALYRSMGFVEINAYYHNPITEAVYLEKRL